MSYNYKYEQGLVRRVAPVALLRGVTLHEMLDAKVMGTDPMIPLKDYQKVYDELWDEEKEKYPPPEDLKSMYERYQARYADDGLNYHGRSEIEVKAEYNGLQFLGIIDKMPTDADGRSWICDHKTHKVIPDEDKRFADLQTVLYWWAENQNGNHHDGILWDYIRTKAPTVPRLLVKGGLSKAKNIDTDYETFMGAIVENGLDPSDYSGILETVKDNVFFKRVYLPNPSAKLVTNVVEDFFTTAQEIENSTSKARNMSGDCTMCSYFQLCQAEVRGLDGSFIKKQLFTVRPPKPLE